MEFSIAVISLLWVACLPLVFGVLLTAFHRRRIWILLLMIMSVIGLLGFLSAHLGRGLWLTASLGGLVLFGCVGLPILLGGLAAKHPRKRVLFLSLLIVVMAAEILVFGSMANAPPVVILAILSCVIGPLFFGMLSWKCPGLRWLAMTGFVLSLVVPYCYLALRVLSQPYPF